MFNVDFIDDFMNKFMSQTRWYSGYSVDRDHHASTDARGYKKDGGIYA
jgi:hypothetical protein